MIRKNTSNNHHITDIKEKPLQQKIKSMFGFDSKFSPLRNSFKIKIFQKYKHTNSMCVYMCVLVYILL